MQGMASTQTEPMHICVADPENAEPRRRALTSTRGGVFSGARERARRMLPRDDMIRLGTRGLRLAPDNGSVRRTR